VRSVSTAYFCLFGQRFEEVLSNRKICAPDCANLASGATLRCLPAGKRFGSATIAPIPRNVRGIQTRFFISDFVLRASSQRRFCVKRSVDHARGLHKPIDVAHMWAGCSRSFSVPMRYSAAKFLPGPRSGEVVLSHPDGPTRTTNPDRLLRDDQLSTAGSPCPFRYDNFVPWLRVTLPSVTFSATGTASRTILQHLPALGCALICVRTKLIRVIIGLFISRYAFRPLEGGCDLPATTLSPAAKAHARNHSPLFDLHAHQDRCRTWAAHFLSETLLADVNTLS